MEEKYGLWIVFSMVPLEVELKPRLEPFNYGYIPVVARNKHEAIGKYMTTPGIETTVVDPVSIVAEEFTFFHPDDQKYRIKLELIE